MDFVILLVKQNLVMLLYLLAGYFLFRKKRITPAGSADIGRLLLYLAMPAAIVKSYLFDFTIERLEALIVSFLAALLSLGLAIMVSRIFFKQESGIERFGTAFSNAGFIGIPLVQMTLGDDAVFYISSFAALLNILQWTYGILILTNDKNLLSLKKIWMNPIVVSFFAGILFFTLSIPVPEILKGMIGSLASMNGPLAMIVLGTYLAQVELKTVFTEKTVYRCTVVRLIIIPALTLMLLTCFPEKYRMIKLSVLIAASAPVGSNVAIFAQLYHQNYKQAVKEVCMSTLLCIVTLPIIMGMATYIL